MSMDVAFAVFPPAAWVALAAVFGALWGSFANVVIVRWPRGESVVRPASHCFSCGREIRFYDNIPVISYLLLRGRCRGCGARFSPRYAVIEAALALLSVAVLGMTLLADPPTLLIGLTAYFVWFAFVWALVTAGMIDLETFLLPDAITLPGIAVGIAANAFVLGNGWIEPLATAAGGFLVLSLLFVHGYRLLTGAEGMGRGDPKLVAMIGAFVGLKGTLFALFAGAIQGLVVGSILVLLRRRRGDPEPSFPEDAPEGTAQPVEPDPRFRKAKVPFGPFLALGAIEYVFLGPALVDAYLGGVVRLLGV